MLPAVAAGNGIAKNHALSLALLTRAGLAHDKTFPARNSALEPPALGQRFAAKSTDRARPAKGLGVPAPHHGLEMTYERLHDSHHPGLMA